MVEHGLIPLVIFWEEFMPKCTDDCWDCLKEKMEIEAERAEMADANSTDRYEYDMNGEPNE